MGNKNGKQSKEHQIIRQYHRESEKLNNQGKLAKLFKKLYNRYDKKKLGYLDHVETKEYLEDVFEVTGLKAELHTEAGSLGRDPRDYVEEITNRLILMMDNNNNGRLELGVLLKPDEQFAQTLNVIRDRLRNENSAPTHAASVNNNVTTISQINNTASETLLASNNLTTNFTNTVNVHGSAATYSIRAEYTTNISATNSVNNPTGYNNDGHRPDSSSGGPAHNNSSSHIVSKDELTTEKERSHKEGKKSKIEAESEGEFKEKEEQWWRGAGNGANKRVSKKDLRQGTEGEEEAIDVHDIDQQDEEEGDEEDISLGANDPFSDRTAEIRDRESEYDILEKKQIFELIDEILDRVCPLLCLSRANAALVLQVFNWDESALNRSYYENIDKYLFSAGVTLEPAPKASIRDKVVCQICFEEVLPSTTYELDCGHRYYCKTCWKSYLEEQTKLGASALLNARCMAKGCKIKVNKDVWALLASEKDRERYAYFFIKNFVDGNKKMKFCPNPQCSYTLRFRGFGKPKQVAACKCGFQFCFSCSMENHNPVTCDQVTTWRDRNQDEEASMKLLLATAKQCPHCGVFTQRTDGCNHMTCRKEHGGCGGDWCWMCRGDWKTHGAHTGGYYSCNRYESSDQKRIDDKSVKLVLEAERYSHFWERYANHNRLKSDAQREKEKIEQKSVKYRQDTGLDPAFLLEALDLLIECRQRLKYTYVYGYFLDQKKSVRKDLFEHQQGNLEGITERLADQLFAPLLESQHLKHMTRVTMKYLHNLIKSFEEQAL